MGVRSRWLDAAPALTLLAIGLLVQASTFLIRRPVTPVALDVVEASFAFVGAYLSLMIVNLTISLVRRRPVRIAIEDGGIRFWTPTGRGYLVPWRDFGAGAILTAPISGSEGYRLDLPVPGGVWDYLTFRGPLDRAASLSPDAFFPVKAAIEAAGIPMVRRPPSPTPTPDTFVVFWIGARGSSSA
jgi:hypothetical protein